MVGAGFALLAVAIAVIGLRELPEEQLAVEPELIDGDVDAAREDEEPALAA